MHFDAEHRFAEDAARLLGGARTIWSHGVCWFAAVEVERQPVVVAVGNGHYGLSCRVEPWFPATDGLMWMPRGTYGRAKLDEEVRKRPIGEARFDELFHYVTDDPARCPPRSIVEAFVAFATLHPTAGLSFPPGVKMGSTGLHFHVVAQPPVYDGDWRSKGPAIGSERFTPPCCAENVHRPVEMIASAESDLPETMNA